MTDFMADADALDDHGLVHARIAQFYRDLAERVHSHGTHVINEFHRVNASDEAANYQQWLSPAAFERLQQEADLHDQWAQHFFKLAQTVRALEGDLSAPPPSTTHGPVAE